MKTSKEQPKKRSPVEIERTNFRKLSELLNLVDEEAIALDRAMALVKKDEPEAEVEIKEGDGKREIIIRSKKDGSILFYNDFGPEEHEQQIEEEIRKLYN
ncbi:MAG TPA: hypothetical protein VJ046_01070 [Candidatus Paceibacterota bacterium]|nr:hypothetical protein [Candidatus Paceibacterota bacterium]